MDVPDGIYVRPEFDAALGHSDRVKGGIELGPKHLEIYCRRQPVEPFTRVEETALICHRRHPCR